MSDITQKIQQVKNMIDASTNVGELLLYLTITVHHLDSLGKEGIVIRTLLKDAVQKRMAALSSNNTKMAYSPIDGHA